MNLQELNAPLPKPWLNIVANSMTADVIDAGDMSATLLSLQDTASVPNPPVGSVSFFSTGTDFKATDPLGNTSTFLTSASPSAFLPLAGGTMAGDIDMDGFEVANALDVSLSTNGAIATPAAGVVALYQDDGLRPSYIDSTSAQFVIANTSELAAYLPLAGGVMAGDITMSSFAVAGAAFYGTANDTVSVGVNNSTAFLGDVCVGGSNITNLGSAGISVLIGNDNNCAGSPNGEAIMVGFNNDTSATAGGTQVFGFNNTNGDGQRNILIGRNITIPNGVNNAIGLGFGASNSISESLVVGSAAHANIRAGSTICDLGTVATPFKDVHLSGGIVSASNLQVTSSNLGVNMSSFGGATGAIGIANATVAPAGNPVGGGVLYCTAGALFYKGSGGTITPLALA